MDSACSGFIRPVVRLEIRSGKVNAVDEIQRIQHVALGLAHLVAFRIADQPGYIHLPERHFAGEIQRHHHHARHPEENDVKTRDQNRSRQKGSEFRRFFGPAQGGERP